MNCISIQKCNAIVKNTLHHTAFSFYNFPFHKVSQAHYENTSNKLVTFAISPNRWYVNGDPLIWWLVAHRATISLSQTLYGRVFMVRIWQYSKARLCIIEIQSLVIVYYAGGFYRSHLCFIWKNMCMHNAVKRRILKA